MGVSDWQDEMEEEGQPIFQIFTCSYISYLGPTAGGAVMKKGGVDHEDESGGEEEEEEEEEEAGLPT